MNSQGCARIGMVLCLWPAMMFAADAAVLSQEPSSVSNPLALQSLSRLSMTLERPLFAPSRRKPVQPVPIAHVEAPPPPPAPPAVILLGVLKSDDATQALLRTGGTEKIAHVRLGDKVGGWTIAEITARSIVLSLNDRTLAVPLFSASNSSRTGNPQLAIKQPLRERAPRNQD
jgi:hypothetical protein